ncbi:hypothetical protein HHI36_018142 [Cryptolaemus montrouzieri]|uniref:Peptidase C1A papain C-terminal domain-containing protein n=1 Tax=Cryptolaemus montrouzieri TaxID=559131 RepID=A0ABD2NZ56_9CUCU
MHCRIIILSLLLVAVLAAIQENPLSDAYIDKINSIQSSWRAGRNFDVNTSLSKIKVLMGVKPGYKTKLPKKTMRVSENLPETFDARENWPNCPSIKEIRDQSSCGSCWAFGAVEAMSDRICIFSNGTKQVSLSANDVLACAVEDGCNGAYADYAWEYWVSNGIVSGGDYGSNEGCQSYPFPSCGHFKTGSRPPCEDSPPTPKCSKQCDASSSLIYKDDLHYGRNFYNVYGNEKKIRSEIFENGPVEASMMVYVDLLNYKSGVYKRTTEYLVGGHSVKVLGWGVENDLPYWLIANSWNEDWGDKGYFKILRGSDECGIEDDIVAGIPKL